MSSTLELGKGFLRYNGVARETTINHNLHEHESRWMKDIAEELHVAGVSDEDVATRMAQITANDFQLIEKEATA